MNAKEIKALVKALRANGVTRYKGPDIELDLAPIVSRETEDLKPWHNPSRYTRRISKDIPEEEGNLEPTEIKHVVEEVTSLLKLSDKDLVDRLFPDHTDYGEGEESATDEVN